MFAEDCGIVRNACAGDCQYECWKIEVENLLEKRCRRCR